MTARSRNAEICACVVRVAGAFVRAVTNAQEKSGLEVSCRAGVASGGVVGGMLGKLQPRFQLLGAPVLEAQALESQAGLNEVNVSPEVRALIQTAPRDAGTVPYLTGPGDREKLE